MALLNEEFEKQGNWLFKYRGVLPIIVLFLGAFVYVYTELHPETFCLEGTQYEVWYELGFCLPVSLLGLVIRAWAVGYSAPRTSGRNAAEGQVADSVNTRGIYSTVRHPLYLGNFLMWLGIAFLTGNFWFVAAFCLVYWLYYERIMYAEEQFMTRKFGAEYADWAQKTPAFIPNFRLYKRPETPFNWKKVLRQEKNGLLALFLIFCILDLLGELVENEDRYSHFLMGACAVSVVVYCVFKYLKSRTNLLKDS